jgi:hypothetical protein
VPPGCGCGFGGLVQCWQDIAQFQQFLQCMLSQMGPYPVQGVTDGSNALPGNIGEFMTATGTYAYAANPAISIGSISPIVLPPGDWHVWASMGFSTAVGGAEFYLSPQPAGTSDNMGATDQFVSPTTQSFSYVRLISAAISGNFTVPTLMPFYVKIDQSTATGLTAGTASLLIGARRMR